MANSTLKRLLGFIMVASVGGIILALGTLSVWSQPVDRRVYQDACFNRCLDHCIRNGGPYWSGSSKVNKMCAMQCQKQCSK